MARLDPEQEREIIEAALADSRGRILGPSGAAAKLGVPRQTLESKIANLGMNRFSLPGGVGRCGGLIPANGGLSHYTGGCRLARKLAPKTHHFTPRTLLA